MIDVVVAHGLSGRADLPIPAWLFGWAAAGVLVVSFVSLAAFWKTPRLEGSPVRPLPPALSRMLVSRVTDALCGAFGVFVLGVLLWAGLAGEQTSVDNVVPTFVYVVSLVASLSSSKFVVLSAAWLATANTNVRAMTMVPSTAQRRLARGRDR